MNLSKTLLLTLLICFFAFHCNAQNTSIEGGEYLCNHPNYEKMEMTPKKGGYLKVKVFYKRGTPKSFLYKPVNKAKTAFETKFAQYEYRLEYHSEGYFVFYEMLKREIEEPYVLAKTKKVLRRKTKQVAKMKFPKFMPVNPTSKFHAKNVNRIVFFSEKPIIGKEDVSKVKTSFKPGEKIWAVAYLAQPMSEYGGYINKQNELKISVGTIEEGEEYEKSFTDDSPVIVMPEGTLSKNAIVFPVFLSKDDKKINLFTSVLISRGIAKLEPTDYQIQVRFATSGDRSREVWGIFSMDCSENREEFQKIAKHIDKRYEESKKFPKPLMKNAALEKDILSEIKKWNKDFFKVAITWDKWQPLRDEATQQILGRIIEVACAASNRVGCMYQYFYFIQDHLGGGKYSQTVRRQAFGSRVSLSCKNLK